MLILKECFDIFHKEICGPGKCREDSGHLANVTNMPLRHGR